MERIKFGVDVDVGQSSNKLKTLANYSKETQKSFNKMPGDIRRSMRETQKLVREHDKFGFLSPDKKRVYRKNLDELDRYYREQQRLLKTHTDKVSQTQAKDQMGVLDKFRQDTPDSVMEGRGKPQAWRRALYGEAGGEHGTAGDFARNTAKGGVQKVRAGARLGMQVMGIYSLVQMVTQSLNAYEEKVKSVNKAGAALGGHFGQVGKAVDRVRGKYYFLRQETVAGMQAWRQQTGQAAPQQMTDLARYARTTGQDLPAVAGTMGTMASWMGGPQAMRGNVSFTRHIAARKRREIWIPEGSDLSPEERARAIAKKGITDAIQRVRDPGARGRTWDEKEREKRLAEQRKWAPSRLKGPIVLDLSGETKKGVAPGMSMGDKIKQKGKRKITPGRRARDITTTRETSIPDLVYAAAKAANMDTRHDVFSQGAAQLFGAFGANTTDVGFQGGKNILNTMAWMGKQGEWGRGQRGVQTITEMQRGSSAMGQSEVIDAEKILAAKRAGAKTYREARVMIEEGGLNPKYWQELYKRSGELGGSSDDIKKEVLQRFMGVQSYKKFDKIYGAFDESGGLPQGIDWEKVSKGGGVTEPRMTKDGRLLYKTQATMEKAQEGVGEALFPLAKEIPLATATFVNKLKAGTPIMESFIQSMNVLSANTKLVAATLGAATGQSVPGAILRAGAVYAGDVAGAVGLGSGGGGGAPGADSAASPDVGVITQ